MRSSLAHRSPRRPQTFSKTPAPVVLLRGNGRALCSGGDVMAVVTQAADKDPSVRQRALDFFKAEFELDYAIATLFRRTGKTFVSVMDGITSAWHAVQQLACSY